MENESITYIKRLKFFSLKYINLFLNDFSPQTMNEVFQTNDCPYYLKKNPIILASKHRSTIKYCINTIAFKSPTQIVKINK